MNPIVERSFQEEELILDFNRFRGCTFVDCTLLFHGAGQFEIEDCDFENCDLKIAGAASTTLKAVRSLLSSGGNLRLVTALTLGEAISETDGSATILKFPDQQRLVIDLGPLSNEEIDLIEQDQSASKDDE